MLLKKSAPERTTTVYRYYSLRTKHVVHQRVDTTGFVHLTPQTMCSNKAPMSLPLKTLEYHKSYKCTYQPINTPIWQTPFTNGT